MVTRRRSAMAATSGRAAARLASARARQPSGVVGKVFQPARNGAAISACIPGLTVSGTGRLRAGTLSGTVMASRRHDVDIPKNSGPPPSPYSPFKQEFRQDVSIRQRLVARLDATIERRLQPFDYQPNQLRQPRRVVDRALGYIFLDHPGTVAFLNEFGIRRSPGEPRNRRKPDIVAPR